MYFNLYFNLYCKLTYKNVVLLQLRMHLKGEISSFSLVVMLGVIALPSFNSQMEVYICTLREKVESTGSKSRSWH